MPIFEQSTYKGMVFPQLSINQSTPYPKLCSFAAPVKEEIAVHRQAPANDGPQQSATYTDDRGENR
jgi:hypothetical protein